MRGEPGTIGTSRSWRLRPPMNEKPGELDVEALRHDDR